MIDERSNIGTVRCRKKLSSSGSERGEDARSDLENRHCTCFRKYCVLEPLRLPYKTAPALQNCFSYTKLLLPYRTAPAQQNSAPALQNNVVVDGLSHLRLFHTFLFFSSLISLHTSHYLRHYDRRLASTCFGLCELGFGVVQVAAERCNCTA